MTRSPGRDGPDQEVEDAHLRDPVRAASELMLDLVQDRAVSIQISLVAAYKPGGALPKRRRRARPRIVLSQVRLDDAVEHRDQGRPLLMQRFRHLRVADSADVCERVEEPRQRDPRDRAHRVRQRGIRGDLAQGAFDLAAPFENRRYLGRRDPRTAAVRQPEIALIERRRSRGIVGLVAGIRPKELERQLEGILDLDTTAKND
jgi:hypothetical protein